MKLNFLVLLGLLSTAYSYHILCVFPVPSHSHNQLGKGIVDALLKAGHTVTWVTPYPEKAGKNLPKTLKLIDVNDVKRLADVDMTDNSNINRGIAFVKEFSNNVTEAVLTNSKVRDVLVNTQFDAVVTEAFFCDAVAGYAAIQQVPWIVLAASQMMPNLEAQVDEVRSVTTIPLLFNEATIPMSFKERVINTVMYTAMSLGTWMDRSTTISMYERHFAPLASARNVPLPPFDDAFHNVSILFLNSHESIYPGFSLPPNVISIAGYHIDENPPPLPKDLQELIDNSPQGVIYFSMGSVLRSAALKPHTRKALLAKFAKLPYTVLWKYEENIDEKLPPNVHVRPWMPQLSILVHPNVKAFITHGGQLSSLEALRAGVPLLAVPVFGDQPSNAERAKRAGYALRATFDPNMADEIDEKLRELVGNPKYTERVKYLSKLFRDRLVPPSKLVSHYIELAIETKGAYHLRSPSLKYSWCERWMLDALLIVIAALALLAFAVKICCRALCGNSKVQKKDTKKKKN